MATKAELEATFAKYTSAGEDVHRAIAAHDYTVAVRAAEDALPLAWDAVAYQRRYLKGEIPSLPTVDALLRYAPALFAWQSLEAVDAWYTAGKRSDKQSLPHLPAALTAARQAMATAARRWDDLSAPPTGGMVPTAADPIDVWVRLGAVVLRRSAGRPEPHHVSRPDGRVAGKCSECGQAREAALLDALDRTPCPVCRHVTAVVITRRVL